MAEIRMAELRDVLPLLSLIRDHAAFEQAVATINADRLQELLATHPAPVELIVAEGAGGLIGFAALTIDFSLWRGSLWGHLDCLFVCEDQPGSGLGQNLFDCAARRARDRGADRLEWQTPAWNRAAIRFYERQRAACAPKMRFSLLLE